MAGMAEQLMAAIGEKEDQSSGKEIILGPLPEPLLDLNLRTLQVIVTAICKDLEVDWSGIVPQWWPKDVPFCSPRVTLTTFKGAQLRIIHNKIFSNKLSLYNQFCRKMVWNTTKYCERRLPLHRCWCVLPDFAIETQEPNTWRKPWEVSTLSIAVHQWPRPPRRPGIHFFRYASWIR